KTDRGDWAGILGILEVRPMEKRDHPSEERRNFIAKCGRFAMVTPPAIALLLSADGRSYADAVSGGTTKEEKKEKEKEEKPKKVK
ncbi:MAG: hypothetical protein WCH75_26455, partial [Candidatus Binatia bacterium]